ncbi:MAG TPA: DUF4157 domain-containing protein, partial [Gemmatimonadales bacterium]|nr:DUF4157 domain-containing protein [Gemmatimonadales bacterium]
MILRAARAWVRNRRNRYYPRGIPIAEPDVAWLSAWFDPRLLARVRVCRATLPLPHFAGITYGDTILIDPGAAGSGRAWQRLLFHELVHVVQYEVLGLEGFVNRYLRGWAAAGFHYRAIALEEDAYAIEAMFTAEPGRPFPVRDEV